LEELERIKTLSAYFRMLYPMSDVVVPSKA